MESVAAKLAERPDHIAAARVLEEMQADAAKISHKADGVDVRMDSLKCPPPPPPPPPPSVDAQIDSPGVLTKWTIRTDLQVDSPRRHELAFCEDRS